MPGSRLRGGADRIDPELLSQLLPELGVVHGYDLSLRRGRKPQPILETRSAYDSVVRFRAGARTLTALAACAVGLTVSECESLSHMNDPDAFGIHFSDDLSQPVVLALCASDRSRNCEHAYYRDRVAVGKSTGEGA